MHTARAQGCKSQWLCDKHNCPQRDSILGPRALQSDMLPLDHCDIPSLTYVLSKSTLFIQRFYITTYISSRFSCHAIRTLTISSADADKPARRIYRSVKVTKHSTIPYVSYSFLLCNSNFVFRMHHFYDIRPKKMS